MTAQRPNVVVYQEYENLTVTPDVPDLPVLIVGPCFQILDYLDDKADCYVGDDVVYGELNGIVPAPTPAAVILSEPPSIKPGALLDAESVALFFDEARVTLAETETALGDWAATDPTLFSTYATLAAGFHFGSNGAAPGDILHARKDEVLEGYHIKTVKEVVYSLLDFAPAGRNFITSGVQPGDLVTLSADNPPDGESRNGTYVVLRVRSANVLEFAAAGMEWAGNREISFGGGNTTTIAITSPTGVPRTGFPVSSVKLADWSDVRVTASFPGTFSGASWRLERQVADIELAADDFSVAGNEITINTDIKVALNTELTDKSVSYAKIYVQYKALRQDLQNLKELSAYNEMEETLGKYDARNPLFVGTVVAKANTTTSVKIYGLTEDSLTGYLDFLDRISTQRELYAIVPLTYSTSILSVLNNMCDTLADPNYVLDKGIKQKFRVTIGAIDLTTQIFPIASAVGIVGATTVIAPVTNRAGTLLITGGTSPDITALGVIPGYTVKITTGLGVVIATYIISHVTGALTLTSDTAITSVDLTATDDKIQILKPNGDVVLEKKVGSVSVTHVGITASNITALYLTYEAATAHFITDGVVPGDFLQIPSNPNINTWTTWSSWVIDEVISETLVRIVNNGPNTSQIENEIPHLYKRTDGSAVTTNIYARVAREMTKAEQVDYMIEVANSFSSKRLVLCYPDEVDVTGLVDGSKTRTTESIPEVADPQPGYYLACAVGGLTAGKPSQQGFTNMNIAGIDRIYNSSDYFKEEQITDLSNGGIFVFIQENPTAAPICVHEVTTDVSALEFSEYMCVKNLDLISWTNLDVLLAFIGRWNVTPEAIQFVDQALTSTNDTLKSRYVGKIGAPLIDYSIASVQISELSRDRIEAYVNVNTPMTLNTIGLHLVA